MSKGICLFAQKNEKSDYYKQAVACAMSIKAFNPKEQICLITDMKVKTEHEKYFDVTKDIPGNDLSINSNWKIENRCKIYNASPFDRTIVLDVDMLVLESLDNFWNLLEQYELFYTNKVNDENENFINTVISNYSQLMLNKKGYEIEILKDGPKNIEGKIWNICLTIISCDKPPDKSNVLEETLLQGGLKLSLWEVK